MVKCIGVLTSGGDAPGMNSAIRSIVKSSNHLGIDVIGIVGGFKGLYFKHFKSLTIENTSNITSIGGTMLKSSRFEQFKDTKVASQCIENLYDIGIDALIVIGGDGSFRGVKKISELGFPAIAIPATIDNDIPGTCATIGFDSALMTIVNSIEMLKDTARSHERCLLVEVMGRYCSDLAQYGAMASDSEIVICNESDIDLDDICHQVREMVAIKGEMIVVVSENVTDVFELATKIEERTTIECRGIRLGYIQRGGKPSPNDRILASRFGIHAVELLNNGKSNLAICWNAGEITYKNIDDVLNMNTKSCGIYEDFKKLR